MHRRTCGATPPKEESRSLGQQKPALEVDLQPMKKDRDLLKAPGAGPAGRRFSNKSFGWISWKHMWL
ncbi:unnamed protein product [Boreogadus saida]